MIEPASDRVLLVALSVPALVMGLTGALLSFPVPLLVALVVVGACCGALLRPLRGRPRPGSRRLEGPVGRLLAWSLVTVAAAGLVRSAGADGAALVALCVVWDSLSRASAAPSTAHGARQPAWGTGEGEVPPLR